MTTTVYQEVCSVFKTKPKSTEGHGLFSKRVAKKINSLEDTDYKELSKGTQDWSNAFLKATDEGVEEAELPEMPGWPSPEEEEGTGDEAAPQEEDEETAEDGDDNEEDGEVSKPKKVAKKAPAKKAVAKKVVAKKKVTKKAASSNGVGRKSKFADDARIKVLVKENPKRKGTGGYTRFGKYKNGMSVSEALEKGLTLPDLAWDVKHKYVSIG